MLVIAGQQCALFSITKSTTTQTTQTASTRAHGQPTGSVNPPAKVGKDYVIARMMFSTSACGKAELTRSLQVRPDAKSPCRCLGDVQAGRPQTWAVGAERNRKLKKYLTAPQVTVILTQININVFT